MKARLENNDTTHVNDYMFDVSRSCTKAHCFAFCNSMSKRAGKGDKGKCGKEETTQNASQLRLNTVVSGTVESGVAVAESQRVGGEEDGMFRVSGEGRLVQ